MITDSGTELETTLAASGIPPRMWEGMCRYLDDHIRPGSFLQAIFANDLVNAMARADDENRDLLRNYAKFLHNELPGRGENCPWGSPEAVEAWLKWKPDKGEADERT